MKTLTRLSDYCREINISAPRHAFFDIRRFQDTMKTVHSKQPPFRHEFYAVALRNSGQNQEVNGSYLNTNLFFNSPYQIITWNIQLDWQGWYIMFDREFIGLNPNWHNFLIDFPFFRLDKVTTFDLPEADARLANRLFEQIFDEYHSNHNDKFLFIQSYTQLLLLLTRRYFEKVDQTRENSQDNRAADILLVSRFQTLVETLIMHEDTQPEIRQPSFYASKLNIHPNHLNAVVKRITGKTATQIIHHQLVTAAKSMLRQTAFTAKEIAFRLHFPEPTHFTAFFKKATGLTPQHYRENTLL